MRTTHQLGTRKYVRIAITGFKQLREFSLDFSGRLVSVPFELVAVGLLWSFVLRGADAVSITIPTMVRYYLCTMLVSKIIRLDIALSVEQDVLEGHLIGFLTKPVSFLAYKIAYGFAPALLFLVCGATLFGIFDLAVGAPGIPTRLTLTLLLAIGSLTLYSLLEYSIGICTVFFGRIFHIRNLVLSVLVPFLSGYYLPVSLFPGWLRQVSQYLPFPYILYAPSAVYVGWSTGSEILSLFLGQATWIALLLVVQIPLTRAAYRKFTGQGE